MARMKADSGSPTPRREAVSRPGAALRSPSTRQKTPGGGKRGRIASQEGPGNGRQKMMMALIPVLAVALVYLLKNPLSVSTVATAQSTQPALAEPVAPPNTEITWEIPSLYQPGARDPMRLPTPPVEAAVEEPVAAPTQTHVDLVVTGILHSEDRPAAIVDTVLVHEGEQISGATIKRIEKNSVEFEMNGRTWKQTVETDKKR